MKYKLGLALSGGGARGLAHFGVMQAMKEYGIKPDIISGTSAGAIAGAMLATERHPEECLHFFTHKKMMNFARFTLSKSGLMSMSKMRNHLKDFLQIQTFDDLKIPLVVTATDMKNATSVHFNKGELIPCVVASCSIPILFTPTKIDGINYVDGGVFMNLPVRPIRNLCEKVIAVEINSIDKKRNIANMLHIAERSLHLSLASNSKIDKNLADLVIAPDDMIRFSIFDLNRAKEIYEQGYLAAKETLKEFNVTRKPQTVPGN
ncbi:patatin-like phospholipase family protein [Odoribacter lunatus]|uniref:patatin-like phospholipase family protein n=1 Tax=Odoribacter lunatus TaxID=2941335 RepID=UPI00203DAADC|nr:patatin-like phospholipase family protein [Odoribacter lunatus]